MSGVASEVAKSIPVGPLRQGLWNVVLILSSVEHVCPGQKGRWTLMCENTRLLKQFLAVGVTGCSHSGRANR